LDFRGKLLVLDLLVATVTTRRPPDVLILTSWNRPVSISAFKPSSMLA